MTAERMEKAFLGLTLALLVAFLGALFYSAFAMGAKLPDRAGEIAPGEVMATPPFDQPGVRMTGPGTYEAVILARVWFFQPNEIRVPAGARITFKVASTDVVHGFEIAGTTVNVMVVPGQVSEVTYTFDEPGEYLLVCHEYCGVGHHTMSGRVIVE